MWSLAGLEEMIMPRLSQLDGRLQREIIAIVSNNEPVATYDLTEALLVNRGFSSQEAKIIARSASWLAVVRRDKKEERGFERIADKLLTFLE